MREKVKFFMIRMSGLMATLAIAIVTLNVNSTCRFELHQPQLPKGAEKLRRM